MCEELAWEIKLDIELADRESEAWDMDRPLGWQGSSVPGDRTEAGVRCCFWGMGGPDLSSPCLGWDWGSELKNDLVTGRAGAWKDRQEVRTLVS